MGKCRVLLTFLIVSILSLGVGAFAASAPAAGSFLRHNVSSVDGLVSQVERDKLVAGRYTQVFKVGRPALVSYFKNNLRLTSLRTPTVTGDYYVNKAGKVVRGKRLLPSGTPVFITKSGEVLLDGRCGNPLRASLPLPPKDKTLAQRPKAQTSRSVKATPKPTVKPVVPTTLAKADILPPTPEQPVIEKVLGNPPAVIDTLPLATTPAIEAVAPTIVNAVPAPAVEAIATAPTTALPPVISSGGSGFNFLLPLALLGGVGAAVSGGGGGDKHTNPPTVPEPSSALALASGFTGVAGFIIRRRMRRW